MIGRLRGILLEKQPPNLLIDVNGVGYEVQASMTTFYQLPEINQSINLFTHFVVREDAQLLFGFFTQDERVLFRALLKVNGVGPKLALTILSGVSPDEFIRCINNGDSNSLVKLPGVGKKTADRLIIEMRDHNFTITTQSSEQDAVSALIALGYKPHEATRALHGIETSQQSSEELIRLALKRIQA
ncbi:MAG TPA: Holliday junction branch migration protein RuvA [Gammaproteobacteria bacterium]|nr:Holliday junction branch migration protein RuvA [Gammaproteobacteria bacterium]